MLSSKYEICLSDTGIEYAGCEDESYDTILVYDDFTDAIFDKLNAQQCCIVGPQIIIDTTKAEPVSKTVSDIYLFTRFMHHAKDWLHIFRGVTDKLHIYHRFL